MTAEDVARVQNRQQELRTPQTFEWVHESTPSLLAAAREAGLHVEECPLLVLPHAAPPSPGVAAVTVRALEADTHDLVDVLGAVGAGFAGTDDCVSSGPGRLSKQIHDGLLVVVGAFDAQGAVLGGGSHSPRGTTTELTGIAVLPRARRHGVAAAITQALVSNARNRGVKTVFLSAQDDAVARIYERVGFARIGTACMGGRPGSPTVEPSPTVEAVETSHP